MALPASGPLSIQQIATEFGGTAPHSLNEYYGVAAGIPTSGAIAVNQFYGKSVQQYSLRLYPTTVVAPGGHPFASLSNVVGNTTSYAMLDYYSASVGSLVSLRASFNASILPAAATIINVTTSVISYATITDFYANYRAQLSSNLGNVVTGAIKQTQPTTMWSTWSSTESAVALGEEGLTVSKIRSAFETTVSWVALSTKSSHMLLVQKIYVDIIYTA